MQLWARRKKHVGCTHSCKYCYAIFMKRFTGLGNEHGEVLSIIRKMQ